jgi:fidgetin-like protein 1
MKLSDEDYENLYEASLLEYNRALEALTTAAANENDDGTNDNEDDDKDRRRQSHQDLASRLVLARSERMGVLAHCARHTKSLHALALLHHVQKQASEDAASHASLFGRAFRPPPALFDNGTTSRRTLEAESDEEEIDPDIDAFFRDYPSAMKKDDDDDESDDSEPEEDGGSDGSVQCLGAKKRPATIGVQSTTLREQQDSQQPSYGEPPTRGQDEFHPASSKQQSSSGPFQYTPQEPPASTQSLPDSDAPPQPPAVPPLPDARGWQQQQPRPRPPAEQQHWTSGAETAGNAAARQAAWDRHHAQNPFQTAREFAQASGGDPATGVDPASAKPPPPPPPPAARHSVPPTTLPPPPAPQQQCAPTYSSVGYNPYLKQNTDAPAPEPQPPAIRDSLRRKFQPPKLGSNAGATQQQQQQAPRGRGASGGVGNSGAGMVKHALGGGGMSRPGSSSGRAGGGGGVAVGGGNHHSRSEAEGGSGNSGSDDELPEELQRYGKDLVEKIMGEIMDTGDPVTFAEIAGLSDVKQTVQEVVCWPMKRPDLFTGLRKAPNGLLLFGPPGTGKTLIGKAIAHESGATFFSISSSSLTSKWIGEGEKLVRTMFAVAAYHEPAVVFIDEIDSLLTQRKADENEASRRIKTEFLVQLDGTGTSGQGRVLVVGATNRPQELDDAARRRFVKRLYIPLPEEADRECLLRVLLEKNNHGVSDDEIKKLAKDTAGFSGADLKSLCTEAAMGPIRELGSKALEVDANDVPPIAYKHFRMALRRTKPSVAPADLVQYEAFDATYGFRNAENDASFDEDDEIS